MRILTSVLTVFCLFCFTVTSFAQIKTGENPTQINPASILEMESDSQGILLPRLTNAQRDAQLNWVAGHVIYSTTDSCFQFFDGNIWDCMVGASETNNVTLPNGSGGGILGGASGSFNNIHGNIDQANHRFKKTSDGGYIIVYDTSEGEFGGSRDIVVVKLNANMKVEWKRYFGSNETDVGYSIMQTQDGGYLLGGEAASPYHTTNFLFGTGSNIDTSTTGADLDVAFLLKMDSMGNQQWVTSFGTPVHDARTLDVEELKDGTGYIATYRIGSYMPAQIIDLNGNVTGNIPGSFRHVFKTSWGYVLLNGATVTGVNDDLSSKFTRSLSFDDARKGLAEVPGSSGDFIVVGDAATGPGIARINATGSIVWDEILTAASQGNGLGFHDAVFDSNGDIIVVGSGIGNSNYFQNAAFLGKDVVVMRFSAADGSVIDTGYVYGGGRDENFPLIEAGQNGEWIIVTSPTITSTYWALSHPMTRHLLGLPYNGEHAFLWFFAIDENLLLQNKYFSIEEE